MTLLKDEATARLDDLQLAGMEATGLFEDLEERIEDIDLQGLLAAHAAAQRRLLERLADVRRARGEMPHAADPERSHLEAAGAFVRAMLLPGETSSHYVESSLEAAGHLERHIDDALALDLPAEMRQLLESFKRENEAFQSALEKRL